MSDVLQAMYRGDRDEAERLAAGRDLDVFEAAALGRAERLRQLLAEDASRANAFGDDGFHPLGLACFFGHASAACLFLFEWTHGQDMPPQMAAIFLPASGSGHSSSGG